jgi:thymidylate kinase
VVHLARSQDFGQNDSGRNARHGSGVIEKDLTAQPSVQSLPNTSGLKLNPSLATDNGSSLRPLSPDASDTSGFLRVLFRLLDQHSVRYCVLHSWESLPFELPSDLDVAIHPADRLKLPIVFRRLQEADYVLIQCLNYSVDAFYFVFCWFDGLALRAVPLDFIFEHWRSGLAVPSVKDVIEQRERHRDMWIPSRPHQFAYLLAKKTWKGKASDVQVQRLKYLAETLGRPEAEAIAGRLFLGKWKRQLVDACLAGSLPGTLKRARNLPWLTAALRHPLRLARHVWQQASRLARRWLYPTGLLIAVLGPDGSGKDTIIQGMSQEIRRGFRRVVFYHWRPHFILPRKSAPAVTDPHADRPRGAIVSSLYLMGFVLDYWFGYALRIRHLLTRSSLVVFDRYFYDVIVDPKRARFGGPAWFALLLARLVPRPDITLVLDADEHVMYARKGELSVKELHRQRLAYRDLDVGMTAKKTVLTDQDVAQSVADATAAVVGFLHNRFEHRDEEWLREPALTDVRG